VGEDIDLSSATGLVELDGFVYVAFEKEINFHFYGEDEVHTKPLNALEFAAAGNEDREKLFKELYEIITTLKADKGLIEQSDITRHWEAWTKLTPYEFYEKYPKSVLAYKGMLLEEDYKRQVKFVKDFLGNYDIPTLGKPSYRYNRVYEASTKDKIKAGSPMVSYVAVHSALYPDVGWVNYIELITQDYNAAKAKYDALVNHLRDNMDKEYVSTSETDYHDRESSVVTYFFVSSRQGAAEKDMIDQLIKGVKNISIYLYTRYYKKERWYEVAISFD
jgi:hypothetical protein